MKSRETVRLGGTIEASPRGPLIRGAEGTLWRLKADERIEHLHGQAITVEGVRDGMVIQAYYVAPVRKPPAC